MDYEYTVEYIAGIIDGEGSILVQRSNRSNGSTTYGPRVVVSNSFYPLVEALYEEWGGRIREVSNTNKQVYQWEIWRRDSIKDFLRWVSPHLWEKRPQADLLLTWADGDARLADIDQPLRDMKRGGIPTASDSSGEK